MPTWSSVTAQAPELAAAASGHEAPSGPMDLFRVDVSGLSFLRPAGDHLRIEWWAEGAPVRVLRRF